MGNIRYIILLLSLFNFSLCINEEINIITYLSKVTNDSLKSLALATEKYSRRKVKVQPEHGLADYYDKLNDIEVIEYLLREIKSHPELTYEKYTTELGVKIELIPEITNIKQIERLPLKVLIDLLVRCEIYENQKLQIKEFGGFQYFINTLTREEITKYLLAYIKNYHEIGYMDALFQKAIENGFFNYHNKIVILGGKLEMESMEILRNWALAIAQYLKLRNGSYQLPSLHSFLTNLSQEQLCEYIKKAVRVHYSDLNDRNKLTERVTNYGFDTIPILGQIGGLGDFIYRMPIYTLRVWALTCERYINITVGEVEESIEEDIDTYSRTMLAEYIVERADKYSALNNNDKLNSLKIQYGIQHGENDLINEIMNLNEKNKIKEYALTVNKYWLDKSGLFILNGLRSYIDKVKDNMLKNYIIYMSEKTEELNSIEKIKELSKKYGFNGTDEPIEEDITFLKEIASSDIEIIKKYAQNCEDFYRENQTSIKYYGGIKDYIDSLPKIELLHYMIYLIHNNQNLNNFELIKTFEKGSSIDVEEMREGLREYEEKTLRSIAIVLLKYHRETLKLPPFNGLNDYISTLKDKDAIIEQILNTIKDHRELLNLTVINSLLTKYGYETIEG